MGKRKIDLRLKRKGIFLTAVFVLLWQGFPLTGNVFSEEIKTSDGIIIVGEVVQVNEESFSVKDGQE